MAKPIAISAAAAMAFHATTCERSQVPTEVCSIAAARSITARSVDVRPVSRFAAGAGAIVSPRASSANATVSTATSVACTSARASAAITATTTNRRNGTSARTRRAKKFSMGLTEIESESRLPELNRQPPDYKSGALPIELKRHEGREDSNLTRGFTVLRASSRGVATCADAVTAARSASVARDIADSCRFAGLLLPLLLPLRSSVPVARSSD